MMPPYDEGVVHGRVGQGGRGHVGLQVVRRRQCDELALIDQADAVAVLGLVHEMGGDHDRDPFFHDAVDMVPEFAAGQGIHARGRFVEKKDVRLVHGGAGQCEALFVAEGQVVRRDAEELLQVKGFDHRIHGLPLPGPRQSVHAGEEFEILAHGELAVEGELLGHVAQTLPGPGRAAAQVDAHDLGPTGGGREESAHHLEGGRLARSVGPEKSEDFPLPDLEADMVRGREVAEAFCQLFGLDQAFADFGSRLHGCGQGGLTARAAAEQIDEGVLEARGDLLPFGRAGNIQGQGIGPGSAVLQDDAQVSSLDDPVAHFRLAEQGCQSLPSAPLDAAEVQAASPQAAGEILRLAREQQAALTEQKHRVACLRLVKIGCAPDHGDALIGEFMHHFPQFAPGNGVDADSRFVEQKQLRCAQKGAGQPEFLLHAAREPAGQAFREPLQVGEGQQPLEGSRPFLSGYAPQIRMQGQVFQDRKIFVEAEFLRHVAYPQTKLGSGRGFPAEHGQDAAVRA
jgi:hypothetical protein